MNLETRVAHGPSDGHRDERGARFRPVNSYAASLPVVGYRHEPGGGVQRGGRVFNAHTTADKSAAIWDRGHASRIGAPICRPQGFELAYSRRFTGAGVQAGTRRRGARGGACIQRTYHRRQVGGYMGPGQRVADRGADLSAAGFRIGI